VEFKKLVLQAKSISRRYNDYYDPWDLISEAYLTYGEKLLKMDPRKSYSVLFDQARQRFPLTKVYLDKGYKHIELDKLTQDDLKGLSYEDVHEKEPVVSIGDLISKLRTKPFIKKALRLHYLDGLTPAQIAAKIKRPRESVSCYLSWGKRDLINAHKKTQALP
jgi:hypothetical protein